MNSDTGGRVELPNAPDHVQLIVWAVLLMVVVPLVVGLAIWANSL